MFAVPLRNGQFGFGQLVERKRPSGFLVGFDIMKPEPHITCDEVIDRPPAFGGDFLHQELRNGEWILLTACPLPLPVARPFGKVLIGERWYVVSWDRRRRRPASDDEIESMQFNSTYSGSVFKRALEYWLGVDSSLPTLMPLSWSEIIDGSKSLEDE